MAVCTVNDVRLVSDVTEDEINDVDLKKMIDSAIPLFNREIRSEVRREKIQHIDYWHQNDVDGSNKTFYLKYPQAGYYIGDKDNSGAVTTDDVTLEEWDSGGSISDLTINSVDAETGKIVVGTAPATGSRVYAYYNYVPVNIGSDRIATQAMAHLAAALSQTKLGAGQFEKVSLRVLDMTKQSESFQKHYDQYRKYMNTIKEKMSRREPHGETNEAIGPKRNGVIQ